MADGDGKWVVDHATDFVEEGLNRLHVLGDKWGAKLEATMDRIADVRLPAIPSPDRSALPNPTVAFGTLSGLPQAPTGDLRIDAVPEAPNLSGLLQGLDLSDLGAFPEAPIAPPLNVPEAPVMANVSAPARPTVDMSVDLPSAPAIVLPTLDALHAINIPNFEFPVLPDFHGQPPVVDFTVPSLFINWQEPDYQSELIDDMTALVKRWFQGGTGLPAPVEQALFQRTRERDASEGRRAKQEAIDVWASRGFDMPPGMLNKQVQAIDEQSRTKAAETNRDIMVEAAKWEIENLRFAVQQGMALEGVVSTIFENGLRRRFEVQKFEAESKLNLFNAQVGLFNARSQMFANFQQLYRTQLDGALAKLQAFRTAVDAQAAIGQLNQQTIEVYKARYEGVRANIEVYKSQMEGARLALDSKKGLLEIYKTDVQAYAEQLGAEKVKFDAYDSRVKGETAKAGMFEAQARAYAATVDGAVAKVTAKTKQADLNISIANAMVSQFSARLDGWKARITADLEYMRGKQTLYAATLDGWRAEAGVEVSQSEAKIRFADLQTRTNIAYAEMNQKYYESMVTRSVQEANTMLEKYKSIGGFASQITAGAMSAANITASVTGTGTVSEGYTLSSSTTKNYNYST